jgi:hypothetical protein
MMPCIVRLHRVEEKTSEESAKFLEAAENLTVSDSRESIGETEA